MAFKSELDSVVVLPRIEEAFEGALGDIPELLVGKSSPRVEMHSLGGPGELGSESLLKQETTSIDSVVIIGVSDSPSRSAFPPREMQDAQNKESSNTGAPLGDNNVLERLFVVSEEKPELDVLLIFNEIDKLCEQAKVLYNQTFARFQTELTRYEGEHKKLTLEADERRELSTKREEELYSLRDCLEVAYQDKTHITEQLEKKDALMKEELRTRDSEILELKRHVSEIVSKRDTVQREVASVGHQLDDARAESNKYKDLHTRLVAVLSKVRAEAKEFVSSYKDDDATANAQARKVSEKAELRLTRAVKHACLESRRQALEDVYAGGINLYADIERVKILEEEALALFSSEDKSSKDSGSDEDGGEIPVGEEATENQGFMASTVVRTIFKGAVEVIAPVID
ncbi:uncharacterized protein [Nicotiana sylvestris]|uniref:uncharacterized protein n=1 Tax=Nicotiana sylvestris TaxID=4096 RepID=UPI00388C9517